MRFHQILVTIGTGLAMTDAHFSLMHPIPIGFDKDLESEAPCGSFNPADRSRVTDCPVSGFPIHVTSSHNESLWMLNAALLGSTTEAVPLTLGMYQRGIGNFCEPSIPGISDWVGKEVVLQVVQAHPEGNLYQVCRPPSSAPLIASQERPNEFKVRSYQIHERPAPSTLQ